MSAKRRAGHGPSLLLRLGILGRVRRVEFPYRGERREGWQVFVTGNENLRRFSESVGARFHSESRRERLREMVLADCAGGPSKDLVPVAVRGVVRTAKERAGET